MQTGPCRRDGICGSGWVCKWERTAVQTAAHKRGGACGCAKGSTRFCCKGQVVGVQMGGGAQACTGSAGTRKGEQARVPRGAQQLAGAHGCAGVQTGGRERANGPARRSPLPRDQVDVMAQSGEILRDLLGRRRVSGVFGFRWIRGRAQQRAKRQGGQEAERGQRHLGRMATRGAAGGGKVRAVPAPPSRNPRPSGFHPTRSCSVGSVLSPPPPHWDPSQGVDVSLLTGTPPKRDPPKKGTCHPKWTPPKGGHLTQKGPPPPMGTAA